jgi:cytidine deaminase
MTAIDWAMLRAEATAIAQHAYAPYSRLRVGAAGLVDDGRIVRGCNVENASYGLTLCAECGLVSNLHATGGGRLIAAVCVDGDGNRLTPCGRCRQLLYEHGGRALLVDEQPILELLPGAFGPDDLPD